MKEAVIWRRCWNIWSSAWKSETGQSARKGQLEEKIKDKDSLIAEQIAEYIRFYNEERLHSALFYLTPKEVFEGKMEQRLEERKKN